jgi:hypothetical protein
MDTVVEIQAHLDRLKKSDGGYCHSVRRFIS